VFVDRVQGAIAQSVAGEVGDFVLLRADGIISYQLAVVVDDAAQGVTDVVRGADLLDSTARQILLQRALILPQPRYLHIPVATNAAGEKLSKQTGAAPLDSARPAEALRLALGFLGQPAPSGGSAEAVLKRAVENWDVGKIPVARAIRAPRLE
jgi:glutamyl-Q tRNA(Asp) synthetase